MKISDVTPTGSLVLLLLTGVICYYLLNYFFFRMDMLMEEKFAKCLLISTLKTSKSSEYHFILTFSTLTPRLSQELNANLKAFCKIYF